MKLLTDNTKREFFDYWSREQLAKECARLNKVLKDCLKIIKR